MKVHTLHPIIHRAYQATQIWLAKPEFNLSYRNLSYPQITALLGKQDNSLENAAAQFHAYFPTHHFKVIASFHSAVSSDALVSWLQFNPRICILDIGCGAGAGSTAFIETVLQLQEQRVITNHIEVFCIGVDPNPNAVGIYYHFLKHIKAEISEHYRISIDHRIIDDGIPNASSKIIHELHQNREKWGLPKLPHCLVMQVNVVPPFQLIQTARTENLHILDALGVDNSAVSQERKQFGIEQAYAYKSIFEGVFIDNLHVFTIATDNYMLDERVVEMGQALNHVFGSNRHKTELLATGEHQVSFLNPPESYWGRKVTPHSTKYHVNITTIVNEELRVDQDWQEVISIENLYLAWVRTRHSILRESFVDEVEILLFEHNLDQNLERMRQQLMAYADDLAKGDDFVAYKVPKNSNAERPRGLSRMEEELLSVAVIQKLGNKESQLRGSSYAYRISQKKYNRETEYLYDSWFNAYKTYIKKSRQQAELPTTKAVIRVDIRSFFTNIVQNQLVEITQQTLSKSQRIHWLIKLLLSTNIDEHDLGRGLVQGSPASGFYANMYLTAIDTRFGTNNEWNVAIFRYVDDIILVVPEQEEGTEIEIAVRQILEAIKEELDKLGLELNEDKTEIYYDISRFLKATQADELLESIGTSYTDLTNSLWILHQERHAEFRESFHQNEQWWFYVEKYQSLLNLIEIFPTTSYISRQVSKYLFNPKMRNRDSKKSPALVVPEFPNHEDCHTRKKWQDAFVNHNPVWIKKKIELQKEIAAVLIEAWTELKENSDIEANHERILQTRIRSASNKLMLLGLGHALHKIMDILMASPWVIREPMRAIEGIARQGFGEEILHLYSFYSDGDRKFKSYLCACVLRSIRFLSNIDSRHWRVVTQNATQGTYIEKLMASESWLYLANAQDFQEYRIDAIEIAKIIDWTNSTMGRLERNYALVLDAYHFNESTGNSVNDELSIPPHEALNSNGELVGIFDYSEPDLIRLEYYSGRRADEGYFEYP
ncbi:MAG: RNA-directed DNA polymerase [Chloroflexota bacterium]